MIHVATLFDRLVEDIEAAAHYEVMTLSIGAFGLGV